MTLVTRDDRETLLKQSGKVIWFTGLPCAGKTTLASALERELNKNGILTFLLDADAVRRGLNQDLSFTEEGRKENIRRMAHVSKLFLDSGIVVLAALIAPFQSDRDRAKEIVGQLDFREVFVDCPLRVCEERDVKGMYKKARKGEIKNFTGLDSPYEAPANPDLTLKTGEQNLEKCLAQVLDWILPQVTNSHA